MLEEVGTPLFQSISLFLLPPTSCPLQPRLNKLSKACVGGVPLRISRYDDNSLKGVCRNCENRTATIDLPFVSHSLAARPALVAQLGMTHPIAKVAPHAPARPAACQVYF